MLEALRWGAIIAAAGSGTRFGRPKQLIEVAGAPLAAWSIRLFAQMPEFSSIVIVTEADLVRQAGDLASAIAGRKFAGVVAGGPTRQASVACGLEALGTMCEAVAVHDGARPLTLARDVRAVLAYVRPGRGAVLAAPVVDTIKQVEPGTRRVRATLDRASLWAAQTPQLAMLADLRAAHAAARAAEREFTDDAALLEWHGLEVLVEPASAENFKVTFPNDLERAGALLAARAPLAQEAT